MSSKPERCWYCGQRRAEVWCDFMLGAAAPGSVSPEQLALLDDGAKRVKGLADVVETCAAACSTCARRLGWRRRGHICCSPRSKSQTIDHCHVHAQADGLGSSAWLGAPAIAALRSDVRAACVRAHAAQDAEVRGGNCYAGLFAVRPEENG